MTTWPNWVDLIIVTILLRTCYNGFGRGLLTELLNLIGVVVVTLTTVNYAGLVASWLGPWVALGPQLMAVLVFWGLFFTLVVVMHALLRRLTGIIKWERLHWFIQGIGLFLGGLRGLWWAGFMLVVFSASGVGFFQESVEKRSVLGPRLLNISRTNLAEIANRFPGAQHRGETLIPPLTITTK